MGKLSISDQYHPMGTCGGLSARPGIVPRLKHGRFTLVIVTAVAGVMSTACAYKGLSMPEVTAVVLHGEGALAAPTPSTTADTYNPAMAPTGARLTANMDPSGETTIAELTVAGMLPNRGYAVHAHTNACGDKPAAAGPHYQNRADPAATPQKPSANPEYANPRNEIWLDVRTDATGAGTARTTVPFVFADRGPGSIVVHEAEQTATDPGQAGTAGARIACITLAAVGRQGFHPLG
jgi:Cu-Zn family superoxide dismutase